MDARALIRERIQEAVARAGEIAPLTMEGPFVLEIECETPWPAQIREGAERVDAFTIRYEAATVWSILHHHFYGQPDKPLPV